MTPSAETRIREFASGQRVATLNGRPIAMRLSKADRERFDVARKKGYLVARVNRRTQRLRNLWSLWCDIAPVADVRVVPRQRYAQVSCDLVHVTHLSDLELRVAKRVMGQWADRPQVSSAHLSARRVAIDDAEHLAAALVRLAERKTSGRTGLALYEREARSE